MPVADDDLTATGIRLKKAIARSALLVRRFRLPNEYWGTRWSLRLSPFSVSVGVGRSDPPYSDAVFLFDFERGFRKYDGEPRTR